MFSSHFVEGQVSHVSANLLELPEDDPSTMVLICQLSHHDITDLRGIPSEKVMELVVLCDKDGALTIFRV
jgi:hypothetical protein